ncbi:MAG: nuclear transport factor 2 family protein [Maribacter sp.]|nr:nuclear transport factor 2 family protein [Maribacter sp.]
MKKPILKVMLKTACLSATLIMISCGDMQKKENTMEAVEEPAVVAAPEEYGEIVAGSLDQFENLDFEGMLTNFTDDAQWLWPDGTAETRSVITGKDSLLAFWNNYKEMSSLKKMSFTNRNLMPLQVNRPTNYYKVEGTVVLYYGDIHAMYEKDTISVRQHIVYGFNEDKKVNRVFLYYDRTDWVSMGGTSISSD